MRSGMFTSVNGDRKYTSEFFSEYFASFIGNGVFPNPSTNLQVMESDGLDISVSEGRAWIDGYILFNDTVENLTLDVGDNLLDRIDKVVIRWDKIDRLITLEVRKGKPATRPNAPVLQRDEDCHELGIANIRVNKASSNITQSNITDLRLNKEQCGIVKGTIEEIDTTTLFNEYQAWLDEKKIEYNDNLLEFTDIKRQEIEDLKDNYDTDLSDYVIVKKQEWENWFDNTSGNLESDFNDWFVNIQEVLDEDTAGNLLNMINDIPKVLSGSTEPIGMAKGDIWLRELS